MNKSTTIINHYYGSDRVAEIIISDSRYIIFTIMHCNIVLVEISDINNPILLLNRKYNSDNNLIKYFNNIINIAIETNDNDIFISNMDTYIDLYSTSIKNETINEIISTSKIIVEDLRRTNL